MTDKITPCDRISIPVYLTYCGEKGIRADKEMFEGNHYIVLRWHEGRRDRQQLVSCPKAWYNGCNYWDLEREAWQYG